MADLAVSRRVHSRLRVISMNEMTEFYQGWMIELIQTEEQFRFVCCSPLGESLSNAIFYPQATLALQAALVLIDHFLACASLRSALRDCFERGRIEFEVWQPLAQSLEYISRGRYIHSPSR